MVRFKDLQPGDIFWERGGGFFGWAIRLGSRSPYAHNGVIIEKAMGKKGEPRYITMEAAPGGVRRYIKSGKTFTNVTRLWRNETERKLMIDKALETQGAPYAFGEIARIIGWGMWQQRLWFAGFIVAATLLGWYAVGGVALALVILSNLWRLEWDTPNMICSNQTSQVVLAGRPDIKLSFTTDRIWPGKLGEDLEPYEWEMFVDCQRKCNGNF